VPPEWQKAAKGSKGPRNKGVNKKGTFFGKGEREKRECEKTEKRRVISESFSAFLAFSTERTKL